LSRRSRLRGPRSSRPTSMPGRGTVVIPTGWEAVSGIAPHGVAPARLCPAPSEHPVGAAASASTTATYRHMLRWTRRRPGTVRRPPCSQLADEGMSIT
jgi:hypothetical protein